MATITITLEDDDGNEVEHELPAEYTVCPCCRGNGSIVNPNVDGNGLTQEDFDQNPGFFEDYMGGVYDVSCPECRGERVVQVIDERACADSGKMDVLDAYLKDRQLIAQLDEESAMERLMGA